MSPLEALRVRLLHLANARPPMLRTEFYALKDRLLNRYGLPTGYEWQRIEKACWGPWGSDGCEGSDCPRCGGTGVFETVWCELRRWEWAGYRFFQPTGRRKWNAPLEPVNIVGRIDHADYGLKSAEAALWLYLFCGEWRLLWRALSASRVMGWYAWPLLNLQRVVMEGRVKLSRRRCYHCLRRFPTWGRGWLICRSCREPQPMDTEEEVPF